MVKIISGEQAKEKVTEVQVLVMIMAINRSMTFRHDTYTCILSLNSPTYNVRDGLGDSKVPLV